jgi:hypothetical protein
LRISALPYSIHVDLGFAAAVDLDEEFFQAIKIFLEFI